MGKPARSPEPGRANNEVVWIVLPNRILSHPLGVAVHRQGRRWVRFEIGPFLLPIEDKVCGDVDEGDACFCGGLREQAGCCGIEEIGFVNVAFGLIHRGIGRAIEEKVEVVC